MLTSEVEEVEMITTNEKTEKNEMSAVSTSNKNIGLFDAICLVYGCIVGSGIFISVSATFQFTESESIGFVLLVWVIGGIIALIGGFCYVELGMRLPVSGGERTYYSIAISPKLSVVFTWIYVYLVKTITIAALSMTAGVYLVKMFIPNSDDTSYIEKPIAAALILLCMVVNSLSSKIATKSQMALTILKTIALLIIICSGIYYLSTGHTKDWQAPFKFSGFSVMQLAVAFINVCWTLEGWNTVCFILGEMKNPIRDLPIAMFIGVFSVLIFYLLVIISYSSVLGYDIVKVTDALGVQFSITVLKQAFFIIPLLASFSAIGAMNGTLLSVSRVAMSAGYANEIPRIFSLVDRKQRTPVFSIFTMSLISLIFLQFKFQILLQNLAFVSWGFYFISTCCLLIFKYKPQYKPKNKIIQIPVVFVVVMQIASLFMVIMSFVKTPIGCSIILSVILVILGVQFIPKRFTQFPVLKRFEDKCISFFEKYLNLVPACDSDVS